ncbi:hypothetical protein GJ744_004259 [Endocarpon pusillum]|uniref:Uncharacterized protein n=1 Tax=Endocarpon pusillum TaxID=364733 RepID=A0A8H7DZ96_9EURO|nr:hypothetical protein GJ744_004259 [Endocarpon pusillum]
MWRIDEYCGMLREAGNVNMPFFSWILSAFPFKEVKDEVLSIDEWKNKDDRVLLVDDVVMRCVGVVVIFHKQNVSIRDMFWFQEVLRHLDQNFVTYSTTGSGFCQGRPS